MTPPDSGEREVLRKMCWCGRPSRFSSRWCGECRDSLVSLPLLLAQRILAALNGHNGDMCQDCEAIAAELREVMGK